MSKNTKAYTRGWPPERRAAQAKRARQNRPWEHTTGPKTQKGKDAVKLNALKHGLRNANMRQFTSLLFRQRCFVNDLIKRIESCQR